MFTKSSVFTRKKALLIVAGAAFLLLALIFVKWRIDSRTNFTTLADREKFLKNPGWEIDTSTEEFHSITIPESFDGIMAEYNRMQREQGFDMEAYCGKRCEQYSYLLTNYPDCGDSVIITIYIIDGKVIAGDIHTAALDGFMHGIIREN